MKQKSKVQGIYKRCACLSWEKCAHPWWGRFGGNKNRVNLSKWCGKVLETKETAKLVFLRMQNAVLADTFDPHGEHRALASDLTFSEFLKDYRKLYIDVYKLKANSLDATLGVFERTFGEQRLTVIAKDPMAVEKWLHELASRKNWANATFNRYFEVGRALFNWAKARKLVSDNPFDIIESKSELNRRDTRITPEQEQKLLEACDLLDLPPKSHRIKLTWDAVNDIRLRAAAGEPQNAIARACGLSTSLISEIVNRKIWNPSARKQRTLGREVRRRIVAAIDLGLREGEMLRVQVKHIDFETWTLNLPAAITKANKDQQVFAGTERIREVLTERKTLGSDAYVFGKENGDYVASFRKLWRRLFKVAGLAVGRKNGLVWHDLRHEFGSYLVEQGATIQEVKELMRHADIRTTQRYLKAREARLRELSERMSERRA